MASNTQNLNLYKADPVADANDTFNIDTLLNDNWDKIDQKAGEQENKLTALENEVQQPEYSGVLTQNKPVFSVGTGYDEQGKYVDVGETVVKGQINHVRIKGSSVNQMVKNGNLVTSYISADNGTFIGTKTDGTYVQNANYSTNEQVFNVSQNDKLFIYHKVKTLNIRDWALLRYSDGSSVNIESYALRSSEVYGIATADKNGSVNVKFAVGDAGTLKRDYQIFINMTANGIEDWAEEKMLELCRMGYWEGTKSTNSVLVKSISKNLFDKDNLSYPFGTNKFLDADGIPRTSTNWVISDFIKVKPNEDYRFTNLSSSSIAYVCFYRDGVFISSIVNSYAAYNYITTPSNVNQLKFSTISGSDGSRLDIIQLEEGTTATPYVEHDFSKAYVSIPFNDGELTRLLNGSVDSVDLNSGIATQRNKKYVLQSGDITVLNTTFSNLDRVQIVLPGDRQVISSHSELFNSLLQGYTTIDYTTFDGDKVNSIGKCALASSDQKLYVGVAKGTYANLAAAQADLAGTSVIYQLVQEKEYNMNITPLPCYPNGTIMVEPWNRMVLNGSLDWKPVADKDGYKLVGLSINNILSDLRENFATVTKNDGKILTQYTTSIDNIDCFSIGNYTSTIDGNEIIISIADTDTDWAESYTPTQADIKAYFNARPYILEYATDPSQTTLPTISYKSPINAAAQRDSNTNAIAQLSDIVAEHDLIVAGQKNEVQQPEYSGMLTQNKPVFSVGTGYDEQGKYVDVVDSVIKGQISDVVVKGKTIVHILKNGDFNNGTTGWNAGSSSVSVSNNILSIIGNGSQYYPHSRQNDVFNTTDKYFVYAKVRITNSVCTRIRIIGEGNSNLVHVNNPIENQWYELYTIRAPQVYEPFILQHSYPDAATANGKAMEIDGNAGVFAINMTANGIEHWTEEQMLELCRMGYWEGVKSTLSHRIKSVGKNLFNVQNITTLRARDRVLNEKTFRAYSNRSFIVGSLYNFKLKPNTVYTFKHSFVLGGNATSAYNRIKSTTNGDIIRTFTGTSSPQHYTFTTPSDGLVHIEFARIGGTGNNFEGWIDITDIMLVEGGEIPTSYVEHEFSEVYYNWGEAGEGKSLPNGVADEIDILRGKMEKKIEKVVLQSSDFVSYAEDATTAQMQIPDWMADNNSVRFRTGDLSGAALAYNTEGVFNIGEVVGATFPCIFIHHVSNTLYLNLPKSITGITDSTSFKAYLDNNPVTLIYQLAQEKEYNMNITPLSCYPNGEIMVESWNRMVLNGGLNWEYSMDFTGGKRVLLYIPNVQNITDHTTLNAICTNSDGLNIPKGNTSDGGINVHNLWGTNLYINLSNTDTGWAESYTPTQADVKAYFNAHPYILEYATDPSQTTLPTISYKAPINAAAQRDSNTNAVAQLNDIVAEHDLILLSIAAGQK